ncbi:ATP-binding protein [Corynebacterium sp. CNCTC7651]|nr:ATP-binding protein [Corynebacterium sp. CNCTC7651]
MEFLLEAGGAVIVEGPRGCGKTMTGLHHSASFALIDDPATNQVATLATRSVLAGPRPRLLDEWQTAPDLFNLVRREVDATDAPGQFILAGSAVPPDSLTRHTGAGRFLRMRQRTLTLYEKAGYAPEVSLAALFDGEALEPNANQISYEEVIQNFLIPGFPGYRPGNEQVVLTQLRAYLSETARSDMQRVADLRITPLATERLITAIARSTAAGVSVATLRKDLDAVSPGISLPTVKKLLDSLQRIFVVEAVPAWAPRLRSKARLRVAPKHHLADVGLAIAALGATSNSLSKDPETTGLLFESAVVHDLAVMVEAMGGSIHHYRDSNGNEIDAVLTLPDGRWAAVEVKLGFNGVEHGIASLRKATASIDHEFGPPAFKAIITGTGVTATLADGFCTFPLHQLKPN